MTKSDVCNELLSTLDRHPVLLDIGSSGAPPEIWKQIARHSIYVGFDPDLRELHDVPDGQFHRSIIVNEAVVNKLDGEEVSFYLTCSPYCSSTLKPNSESLSNFLISDLFVVERETKVKASTLNSVLDRLSLSRIDWFKTDSQGIDLRLFESLREDIRSSVLAIDIEPGLVDGYIGEDLFIDVHKNLTRNGFWLSNINVCGALRMRKSAFDEVTMLDKKIDRNFVEQKLKKSPAWCEARYLRTIDSLPRVDSAKRDYVLLWIFTLVDEQLGFAFDLSLEYERVFGADDVSQTMKSETIRRIRRSHSREPVHNSLLAQVKALVPAPAKRVIKRLIR